MKSYKFLLSFTLLMAIFGVSFAEAASKVRVAVLNDSDVSEWAQQSEIIANNFRGVLSKSGAVTVVEREKLELVMREHKITASQIRNSKSGAAKKIGKLTGCQYILLSSLVYDVSPIISVRIVDNQTSEIIFSDTKIPDSLDDSAIISASSRLADEVLEMMVGEQAVITEIRGKEIVINRGSSSGVRKGNFYRVYMTTKNNPVDLAVIKIKDVKLHFSNAEIVKNGGSINNLHRVDKVESISKKEADSLIKRKNFAKKRPDEKEFANPAIASRSKIDSLKNDDEKILSDFKNQFNDLLKQGEKAIAKKDSNKLKELGNDFFRLGYIMKEYKASNELDKQYQKLGNTQTDNSLDVQKLIKSHQQELDKLVNDCLSEAVHLLRLSAVQGNVEAQAFLGGFYMLPHDWGVQPDYKEAVKFLNMAVAKGHADAHFGLGMLYQDGLGVKQDYQKAVELYSKAVAIGSDNALHFLGFMYLNGLGVKQDYKKAVDLFRRSAEKGISGGQHNLGYMYQEGLGVPQDIKKAIELYRKAAAQGNINSINQLKYLGADQM